MVETTYMARIFGQPKKFKLYPVKLWDIVTIDHKQFKVSEVFWSTSKLAYVLLKKI